MIDKPVIHYNGILTHIEDRSQSLYIRTLLQRDSLVNENNQNIAYRIEEDGTISVWFGFLRLLHNKGAIEFIEEKNKNYDGLVDEVVRLFEEFEYSDPNFKRRDYQISSVVKAYINKRGLIEIATGGGKSEVFIALTMLLGKKTLIVNNLNNITQQIKNRYIKRGLSKKDIKFSGVDRNWTNSPISISTTTTIYNGIKRNKPEIINLLKEVEVLIFDEAHHSRAESWSTIAALANPEYCFHFTGTGVRNKEDPLEDPSDAMVYGVTGGPIVNIPSTFLRSKGWQPNPIIHYLLYPSSGFKRRKDAYKETNWHLLKNESIIHNHNRNSVAIDTLVTLDKIGVITLAVTDSIQHGRLLLKMLDSFGVKSLFSYGGNTIMYMSKGKVKQMPGSSSQIDEVIKDGTIRIVIGSSIYDEGVDISSLEAVMLLSGGKSARRFLQRVGRIRSRNKEPNVALVFDFWDPYNIVTARHSNMRKKEAELEAMYIEDNLTNMFNLARKIKS